MPPDTERTHLGGNEQPSRSAAGDAADAGLTPAEREYRTAAQDPSYRGTHPEPRFLFTEEEAGDDEEREGRRMVMNFGPQHPAMHGTLRAILRVDGERVAGVDTEIGYLHTGFEKLAEHMTYQQWVTVTDRMNYLSAMNNNVGYAIACEELFGLRPPRRAEVIRVILSEVSRIADHVLCCGLAAMDVGAFSLMLWTFEQREKIYDIMEVVTGTRLTTSYTRIGGLFRDVPPEFPDLIRQLLDEFPRIIDEFRTMVIGNRIFEDRMRDVGVIGADEAISWGLTGPILRASGVPYDVRKSRPYSGYERYEFDVPIYMEGDSLARINQRLDEMGQSLRIIRQALDDLPDGPVNCDDKKSALPEKLEVYQNIESVIHHFKQLMFGHGNTPEPGAEVYSSTEAPNGELGFFIVSDGAMVPYRVRVRPPSLYHFAAFPRLVEGHMISDVVAALSTLNVIAGELDR